jgi:hypothetical protein
MSVPPPDEEVRIEYGSSPPVQTGAADTIEETPASAAPELTTPREPRARARAQDDLPLHLRVLMAFVGGEPDDRRLEHAFTLAMEIYELEKAAARGHSGPHV